MDRNRRLKDLKTLAKLGVPISSLRGKLERDHNLLSFYSIFYDHYYTNNG